MAGPTSTFAARVARHFHAPSPRVLKKALVFCARCDSVQCCARARTLQFDGRDHLR